MINKSEKKLDKYLDRDLKFLFHLFRSELYREKDSLAYEQMEDLVGVVKRYKSDGKSNQILKKLKKFSVEELSNIIRVLTILLDLSNIAEDQHRIRVLNGREDQVWPQARQESVADAISILKDKGLSSTKIKNLIQNLSIELVKTAHPTEAKRRITREMIKRVRNGLNELEQTHMSRTERRQKIEQLSAHIGSVWGSELIRAKKPTVYQELRNNLFVHDALWKVVPDIYRDLRYAFKKSFNDEMVDIPKVLSFGSWIGSDRDGNPNVTAETIQRNLDIRHQLALKKHIQTCDDLIIYLCLSNQRHPVDPQIIKKIQTFVKKSPKLKEIIENISSEEVYRQWLAVIKFRLEARKDYSVDRTVPPPHAYVTADEFLDDLQLMKKSLEASEHHRIADEYIQSWMDKVISFGFHMARCDVRFDSADLNQTFKEIVVNMGSKDVVDLSSDEFSKWLGKPLDQDKVQQIKEEDLSLQSQEILSILALIRDVSASKFKDGLGVIVLSMFHHPNDALTVIWLNRFLNSRQQKKAKGRAIPIAPLFETIQDLQKAPEMLASLLENNLYAKYLEKTNEPQVIMVGYSDSTKDGGYLAANWWLFSAQKGLVQTSKKFKVPLTIFHGRGGALGRGGGPTARAILSQPTGTVDGRFRMTEQGEVLADRYDDERIGYRHLEQVTWATLLMSREKKFKPAKEWLSVLEQSALISQEKYQSLKEHEKFISYFREATPIKVIEDLPVGSRPTHRSNKKKKDLKSLRAIPYTFSWTQSRNMITAFYGLGTGLKDLVKTDLKLLREMYEKWPYFKGIIDNAQLALIKFDPDIVKDYAKLSDENLTELANLIVEEADLSEKVILKITKQSRLFQKLEWLRMSLNRRDPLVDTLNYIQIELMQRSNSATDGDKLLSDALRLSVQGLASGLRTTG